MKSMEEIEWVAKKELMYSLQFCPGRTRSAIKANSRMIWIKENLYNYIHDHRDEDPSAVLENYIKMINDWLCQTKHEEMRDAFIEALDYAECFYDGLILD